VNWESWFLSLVGSICPTNFEKYLSALDPERRVGVLSNALHPSSFFGVVNFCLFYNKL